MMRIDFIPGCAHHTFSARFIRQNLSDRLFGIVRSDAGHAFQHGTFQRRGVGNASFNKSRNGVGLHMNAGAEQLFLPVSDARREQSRSAAHALKNSKIQIALFTDVDDKPGAGKKRAIVSRSERYGNTLAQQFEKTLPQRRCFRIDGSDEQTVPFLRQFGKFFIFGQRRRAGRMPEYALGRKSAAPRSGEEGQMIAQTDETGVKGLPVKGKPAVDVGIHGIKNCGTGKVFDAEQIGGET